MLGSILEFTMDGVAIKGVLICTAVCLVLGLVIAGVYMIRSQYTKNFVVTLALLPAMVQAVIMLVNGNLGTGVAIVGAFSLIRFRSVPGSSREIATVFFAMAVGLATGMGYVTYAAIFTAVISVAILLYSLLPFGNPSAAVKTLKITIPETMDYEGIFDDLFAQYTRRAVLERVRTTNLGSLYELQYTIVLKDVKQEKAFLDEIRCRNGNLNILCARGMMNREEL